MKILDLLRKLGILRFGTKSGTYTSYKNMPPELFQEDVYDAQKDLVHKEDLKKAAAAVKSLGGRKILFWIAVALGAFSMLMFIASSGLTYWFIADFTLWAVFIILLREFAFAGRFSYLLMIILLVLLVFISLVLLGAAAP